MRPGNPVGFIRRLCFSGRRWGLALTGHEAALLALCLGLGVPATKGRAALAHSQGWRLERGFRRHHRGRAVVFDGVQWWMLDRDESRDFCGGS